MIPLINPLFPTFFISDNIGREITKEEIKAAEQYLKEQDVKKHTSNYGTKSRNILNNVEFSSIKQFIEKNINFYVQTILDPKTNLEFYITESWINYTNQTESHHVHKHQNSIISGVFYLHVNDNVDCIEFYKEEYQQIKIYPKNWNTYNSTTMTAYVKTGDLLLFPSNLPHGVPPVNTDKTRVSLAFNVFAKGEFGSLEDANFLVL